MPLSAADLRNFSFAYGSVFNKIFKVRDATSIELCQYYCYLLPFNVLYDYLRFCFLAERFNRGQLVAINPFDKSDFDELTRITLTYNFLFTDAKYQLKCKMLKVIENSLLNV